MLFTEAENMIASMLLDDGCDYEYYIENVKEDYYLTANIKKLHRIIIDLKSRNVSCDRDTILLNIDNKSDFYNYMGTVFYNSSKFKEVIRCLKLEYTRRKLERMVTVEVKELREKEDLTDFDIEVMKNNIKTQLADLDSVTNTDIIKISDSVDSYIDYLNDYKAGKIDKGLLTGFPSLDRVTYGFKGNQFIILAALEGVGKTSLALAFINHWIDSKKKVLFFSLEMNNNQLMQRLISIRGGIPSDVLKDTEPLPDSIKQKIIDTSLEIQNSDIFINTDMDISVDKIMTTASKLKNKYGLDAVIIDHVGLLMLNEESGKDERTKMNYISRNLKRLSKELNIPVITLSQFSRNSADKNGFNIPTRKSLKESGSLEQDADIVMILHRWLNNEDGSTTSISDQTKVAINFDKHRDGERRFVDTMYFDLATTTFKDKLSDNITIS